MTTVACNKELMASDSLACDNDIKTTAQKIFRVGHDIVGVAGEYQAGLLFVEWYHDRRKSKPDVGDGFEAFALTAKSIFKYESRLIPMPIEEEFAAIGSGGQLAIMAMTLGLPPHAAVREAAKLDVYSGGKIQKEKL